MKNFGILFIIFGFALIIEGIANCHGHKPYVVKGRHIFEKMTKKELSDMGKYIIVIGSSIVVGSIPSLFFEDDNIIPVIILVISIILFLVIYNIIKKRVD